MKIKNQLKLRKFIQISDENQILIQVELKSKLIKFIVSN